MMRIERIQEPLQLPQQLNYLGVRHVESFVPQPPKNEQYSAPLSSLRVLAVAASGRPALTAALASAQSASSD